MKGEGYSELATKSFVREEILATRSFVKEEIHRIELSLTRAIFWSGLIQFLAIVGSVIAIVNFVFHK